MENGIIYVHLAINRGKMYIREMIHEGDSQREIYLGQERDRS